MKYPPNIDKSRFIIDRINEINEWRQEAILHAESQAAVERLDAEVLRLRENVENPLAS
jgi:hypothetical protein